MQTMWDIPAPPAPLTPYCPPGQKPRKCFVRVVKGLKNNFAVADHPDPNDVVVQTEAPWKWMRRVTLNKEPSEDPADLTQVFSVF